MTNGKKEIKANQAKKKKQYFSTIENEHEKKWG